MTTITQYRTKDLTEAAFLWSQPGSRLLAVEAGAKQASKHETFFFKFSLAMDDSELRKLLFGYANEETVVEPQLFVRKQNNLRDRLYAVKKRGPIVQSTGE